MTSGWVCPVCGAGVAPGVAEHCAPVRNLDPRFFPVASPTVFPQTITYPQDRMSSCPCRVENGGSGVCGCVMGGTTITCSTASSATDVADNIRWLDDYRRY